MKNEQLLDKIHLVVKKLMNLGSSDYEQDKTADKDSCRKGIIQRDFGIEEWDWPQGIGLYGLYKLQTHYGDGRYNDFFSNWYEHNIQSGLPSKNINTTAPFLALVNLWDQLPEADNYKAMCLERADWLIHELPKTKEGGFQHVTSAIGDRNGVNLNHGQIWVDTLVMSVLFLNMAGPRYDNASWKDEAVHQFLLHIKYLYDKQTGLFHHGFSFERNDNFGGIFWCRGNSWFTYGVMDYLDACKSGIAPGVNAYLTDTFRAQAEALRNLQAPSGLWHTVLTDETSYEEVSGSAAITAGILKGLRAGVLDSSYRKVADQAIEAICRNVSKDGTVLNVSAGTGIGMDSEHYKNIAVMPMAYGQSLALIALCEALEG